MSESGAGAGPLKKKTSFSFKKPIVNQDGPMQKNIAVDPRIRDENRKIVRTFSQKSKQMTGYPGAGALEDPAFLAQQMGDYMENPYIVQTAMTDQFIRPALEMWCDPNTRTQAEIDYGHISHWDTSRITTMRRLFRGNTFVDGDANMRNFNDDISGWDVRNVTDMSEMFYGATSFNGDISAWDVGNVTDMRGMFAEAINFNGDISAWDVGNVTDMKGMFFEARSFNQPIGGWDTSQVTDMSIMFFKARSFNQYIGGWNTLQVTDMKNMFVDCPISRFNQPGCFGKMCEIVSKPINWLKGLKGRGGAKNTRRRKYKATRRRRSQRRRDKTSTRRRRH